MILRENILESPKRFKETRDKRREKKSLRKLPLFILFVT